MYRIEVAPGEETVFRSIEELAVGIRNGVVTQRSRIFHNASQKWLPIGLHPHYKKALEMPAASASHPRTPTPVPAPPRSKPRVEAPRVPSPIISPVVTMQQEVLRDLPVVAIPEPLPWAAPRTHAPPPPPTPAPIGRIAQAVQAQPTATVTYKPLVVPEPAADPAYPRLEEPHARPTARRAHRSSGRPLLMLGVAATLVLAAHFALSASRSAAADASDRTEPADAATEAADSAEPEAETPPAPAAAETPARVTSAPARVRMTPGPAFAGSVPATPGAEDTRPAQKASALAATPAAGETAPAIAPAPVELDLSMPSLPTDSVVPKRTRDSMAMKKILRALNGAKAAETAPAAP
jgi:hypothetical protein